jgi:selenide,water dikinase
VGLERADDAGVYKVSDELALVQTVDFFTPVVDDPRLFGRIAATNSLSDVWAMGGRPVCAMNVVCFPAGTMDPSVLRQVIEGGLETLHEARVALVGGHSADDPELKYGLSVTGLVHPERFLRNTGARAGDRLVLTKPLGTGIIATAIKGGVAEDAPVAAATRSMTTLNRRASELMLTRGARACTDVTGFGLVGHALEMVEKTDVKTDVGLDLRAGAVPVLPGALELAGMGILPAGLHRNREFCSCSTDFAPEVGRELADVMLDPQTSGGLLVALPAGEAEAYASELGAEGGPEAALIGEFTAEHPGRIVVGA